MGKREKKTPSILKRLYSAADPLIRRLPGRTPTEKRTVFNLILILSFVSFYLSPAPVMILSKARTPAGALLTLLVIFAVPIVFVKYLAELLGEYGEMWRAHRRTMQGPDEGGKA